MWSLRTRSTASARVREDLASDLHSPQASLLIHSRGGGKKIRMRFGSVPCPVVWAGEGGICCVDIACTSVLCAFL